MVVHDLLLNLKKHNVSYSQGFADDLGLMNVGKCPNFICDHMNQSLKFVDSWCKTIGRSVDAKKTQAIYFTNKNSLVPRPLTFGGETITLKPFVRYLGVWLDQRLLWKSHVDLVSQKCLRALGRCRRINDPKWGLSPKIMRRIYIAFIRPALLYGVVAWCTVVKSKCRIASLSKVQRAALLSITSGMQTCPTAAIECIAGVRCLDVLLLEAAVSTKYRLTLVGNWLKWELLGGKIKR